jgi:ABC-type amino acid transport substrate-binding protein
MNEGETMLLIRNKGSRQERGPFRPSSVVLALGVLAPVMGLVIATPAWAGATLDHIKQTGTIRLGVGPEGPLIRKDASGNPAGFALDLCGRIVDGLKADLNLPALKTELVPVPGADGIAAVAQGKVDILCDATLPTTAARKQVSFSIPVFATGVAAVVRADASDRLKAIYSGRPVPTNPIWRGNADQVLRDGVISVVGGSRAEAAVTKALANAQVVPRIVAASDYATGLQQVLDGRSNVFFGDRVALLDAVRRGRIPGELQVLDRYFTQESLAFAVPRDDEELRLEVDTALSRLFRSSELPTVFGKWFGPISDNALTLFRMNALPE